MRNLILSGGGIKGIAYIGCLKYFEENNMLHDLKVCVTCSAGCIFSLAIILGYTSDELIELVNKIDITALTNITSDSLFNYFKTYGLDDGKKLENFLHIIIKKKLHINCRLTLADFYYITGITFYITACCISDRKTVFFSHKTHPDLDLILAIRMSTSYPFYFIPVIYEGKYYIDGGVLNNFPVNIENLKNDRDTISISLLSFDGTCEIHSFERYSEQILNSLFFNIDYLNQKINTYKHRNIIIIKSQMDVACLEFNIKNEKINKLIDNGYKTISDYFKKQN
jgi:predicted acylesterase/phospholipase RssA